jgi:hypothetical protein
VLFWFDQNTPILPGIATMPAMSSNLMLVATEFTGMTYGSAQCWSSPAVCDPHLAVEREGDPQLPVESLAMPIASVCPPGMLTGKPGSRA